MIRDLRFIPLKKLLDLRHSILWSEQARARIDIEIASRRRQEPRSRGEKRKNLFGLRDGLDLRNEARRLREEEIKQERDLAIYRRRRSELKN